MEMFSKSYELVKSFFILKRRKNQMFPSGKKCLEQSVCEYTFLTFSDKNSLEGGGSQKTVLMFSYYSKK